MNNNNNNNNHNQSKIINRGTFGTIRKATNINYIKHKNNALENKNSVFKFFNTAKTKYSNTDYLTKEYDKYKLLELNKIDRLQEYFIGLPYKYEILGNKTKNTKKNTKKTNNNKKKYGLKYLNGGDSLFKLLDKLKDTDIDEDKIKEYLEKFENIFKGILLLHDNGIYHLDIKPQNIVYDGNTMRLIDFGGSILIDKTQPKISLMESLNIISTNGSFSTLYCPKEMIIAGCDINKYENFIKQLPKLKTEFKENILFIPNNSNNPNRKAPNKSLFNKTIKYDIGAFDIWCLGMTLLDIYNLLKDKTLKNAELKISLCLLIYELLNENYIARPNAQQALELYKKFLLQIKLKSQKRVLKKINLDL